MRLNAHTAEGALREPRGSGAGVPPAAGASRPRIRRGRDAREDSRDGCPTTAPSLFMVPMGAKYGVGAFHEPGPKKREQAPRTPNASRRNVARAFREAFGVRPASGALGVQSAKFSLGEFSPQGEGKSLSALGNSLPKDSAQRGNWLFPVLGERVSSLLKNVWFAAWGHAAYKISSEISMPCRPGALTGRLFQRALKARASVSSNLIWGVVPMKQCRTRRRENS